MCPFCGKPLVWQGPASAAPVTPAVSTNPIDTIRLRAFAEGWHETQAIWATPEQLTLFGHTFRTGVYAALNQYLKATIKELQINYVHAANPQIAFDTMAALVGKAHSVLRKGDVVIEIISHHDSDSHIATWVVEAIRPEQAVRPAASRW